MASHPEVYRQHKVKIIGYYKQKQAHEVRKIGMDLGEVRERSWGRNNQSTLH